MARFDLSDVEWGLIRPLFPNTPRGVARVDDRRVLNGIFWVLRTGSPGATCPSATALTPLSTTGSIAARRLASGRRCLKPLRKRRRAACSSIIRAHQQATEKMGGRITPLAVLEAD